MRVVIDEGIVDLRVAVVEAQGISIAPAGVELRDYCQRVVDRVRRDGMNGGELRREAVRELLRHGGFKPSGRSKPAQEYLLRMAREENALPTINSAVDLINAVSLASGLPISLVARERFGDRVLLRYGQASESYVFNRAGQLLELSGLLCTCRVLEDRSEPLGSPVKDSMVGKVDEADRDVLAIIYAPQSAVETAELENDAQSLADGFRVYCQASEARWTVHSSGRWATS